MKVVAFHWSWQNLALRKGENPSKSRKEKQRKMCQLLWRLKKTIAKALVFIISTSMHYPPHANFPCCNIRVNHVFIFKFITLVSQINHKDETMYSKKMRTLCYGVRTTNYSERQQDRIINLFLIALMLFVWLSSISVFIFDVPHGFVFQYKWLGVEGIIFNM